MHLPNADRAVVSREKIVGYLLNPQHPDGAPKSQFFTKLDFNVVDWRTLANEIGKLARQSPVSAIVESAHGTKYTIEGKIDTPSGKSVALRTVWIVEVGESIPRLVTAYPRRRDP